MLRARKENEISKLELKFWFRVETSSTSLTPQLGILVSFYLLRSINERARIEELLFLIKEKHNEIILMMIRMGLAVSLMILNKNTTCNFLII